SNHWFLLINPEKNGNFEEFIPLVLQRDLENLQLFVSKLVKG
ncbi:MAG: hypothetical protein RLZZ358_1551, partial [Bacteroidota bacterium]